jgi:hypothetical protein
LSHSRKKPVAPSKAISPELSHRSLAVDVIRHAIARHDADEAFALEMASRFEGVEPQLKGNDEGFAEVRRWEEWLGLARHAEGESEHHLIRVVLAASDDVEVLSFYDAERWSFPPRALVDGGRIFVAYPDPDDDAVELFEKHKDNRVVMRLVTLNVSDVASFDRRGDGRLTE